MPNTALLTLPYPNGSDPPAGNLAIESLASAVDTEVGGAWIDFNPNWSAQTSNPSIGNGTLTARYKAIGKTVHLHIHIGAGSTTAWGSGPFSWDLPVPIIGQGRAVGSWLLYRSGGDYIGTAFTVGSAIQCKENGRTTSLEDGTPVTLVDGNEIAISLTYEAA